MKTATEAIVCWSGGKDSSFSLYEILRRGKYAPRALLTTVTRDYSRVSMHGVREKLLEEQARSLGVKLDKVYIEKSATNPAYESALKTVLDKYRCAGIRHVVFGDIFLEDLRAYRVKNLKASGMRCVFPVWKRDTKKLSRAFIKKGFKAVVTCADTKSLNASFCGREYDESFLRDLPAGVDPCGENGEFHTFVYDGPIFSKRINFRRGKKVLKHKRFLFCDLVPA